MVVKKTLGDTAHKRMGLIAIQLTRRGLYGVFLYSEYNTRFVGGYLPTNTWRDLDLRHTVNMVRRRK